MCYNYLAQQICYNPGQDRKIAAILTSVCVCFFFEVFMDKYIDEIIKLSIRAYKLGEVPVGAVVVFNNKIIAKGFNNKIKSNNAMEHAEIVAIKKAAKKIRDWRLCECDLYVTLEPCSMCKEVIKQSRIRNVYYLLDKLDYKKEYNKTRFIKLDKDKSFQQENYRKILSTFFKDKCKR